jgi:hypothetical protein
MPGRLLPYVLSMRGQAVALIWVIIHCRYITRPPLATKRLSLTQHGKLCYELKTPYSDGTTHILFESLDFMSRLAALVPKPRVNLSS